ncbi:GL12838 [Drosophila persimilis]|uniref:GL12838 n=1 Tax=Drosophila persimilis TaxID=7234 RepID=B4H7X1_DROPE|nr:GL12838 [Drosophila persimilis]
MEVPPLPPAPPGEAPPPLVEQQRRIVCTFLLINVVTGDSNTSRANSATASPGTTRHQHGEEEEERLKRGLEDGSFKSINMTSDDVCGDVFDLNVIIIATISTSIIITVHAPSSMELEKQL